jgi:hypothetical protein
MGCSLCNSSFLRSASRAMAKQAGARLRAMGLLREQTDWAARAEICERCPMRVVHKGISYCGKPFLELPNRDESKDGCGCPTRAKAKDPAEHCPITPRHLPSSRENGVCDCKWCHAARAAEARRDATSSTPTRTLGEK